MGIYGDLAEVCAVPCRDSDRCFRFPALPCRALDSTAPTGARLRYPTSRGKTSEMWAPRFPLQVHVLKRDRLKLVPKVLVIDVVVVLHFGRLHECAQQAGAAVGGGLLQVSIALLHFRPQQGVSPLGGSEVFERGVDVVG